MGRIRVRVDVKIGLVISCVALVTVGITLVVKIEKGKGKVEYSFVTIVKVSRDANSAIDGSSKLVHRHHYVVAGPLAGLTLRST